MASFAALRATNILTPFVALPKQTLTLNHNELWMIFTGAEVVTLSPIRYESLWNPPFHLQKIKSLSLQYPVTVCETNPSVEVVQHCIFFSPTA